MNYFDETVGLQGVVGGVVAVACCCSPMAHPGDVADTRRPGSGGLGYAREGAWGWMIDELEEAF